MTLSDEIKALVSTLEMQLNGFAKAAYEKDLRIAELEALYQEAFSNNRAARQRIYALEHAAPSAPAVEQQPVGEVWVDINGTKRARVRDQTLAEGTKLYTAPQAANTNKVREAILAMRCTNPYAEDKCNLYKEGYAVARQEAADLVASMAAQAPVREVPEVNDAKYSEAEKAIGKIIFQRYPRIKGVHCASITIGILEYMGLRHSALNYDQQERVDE